MSSVVINSVTVGGVRMVARGKESNRKTKKNLERDSSNREKTSRVVREQMPNIDKPGKRKPWPYVPNSDRAETRLCKSQNCLEKLANTRVFSSTY